jgi:hypothetical protein
MAIAPIPPADGPDRSPPLLPAPPRRIPNTLEIRPGYRFVVTVNKDMHLRPYVDRRTSRGTDQGWPMPGWIVPGRFAVARMQTFGQVRR